MKYETIIILDTNCLDKKEFILEKMKYYAKISDIEEWGTKRLAYPIKKHNEGYYILINFESDAETVDKLQKFYDNCKEILKSIIVKKD